jgi:hypothetical protein
MRSPRAPAGAGSNGGERGDQLGGTIAPFIPQTGPSTQQTRAERRARERAERDRNRRIRRLALTTFAAIAESDPTISGMALISPNGSVEYVGADLMRRGGRA